MIPIGVWLNCLPVLPASPIRHGSRLFIPKLFRRKGFLGHYATRLNSVEINYTFRQLAFGQNA